MKTIHCIAFILLVIGGINWLLVGLFNADIGVWIFGGMDHMVSKIIYFLVGISAIWELFTHKQNCHSCADKGKKPETAQQNMAQ